MIPGDDLIAIYLNDHLGGATGGLELARRTSRSNPDGELGEFLRTFVAELEEDRAELLQIMRRLDVGKDRTKVAAGWTAEKVGRLKPNGRIVGYSPLSRVLELEGLIAGVNAKLAGWQALRELAAVEARLDPEQLDRLIERGERQVEELRRHHRAAAQQAFAGEPVSAAHQPS